MGLGFFSRGQASSGSASSRAGAGATAYRPGPAPDRKSGTAADDGCRLAAAAPFGFGMTSWYDRTGLHRIPAETKPGKTGAPVAEGGSPKAGHDAEWPRCASPSWGREVRAPSGLGDGLSLKTVAEPLGGLQVSARRGRLLATP